MGRHFDVQLFVKVAGGIIIISLLRHERYNNENTLHNTIEMTITKFPVTSQAEEAVCLLVWQNIHECMYVSTSKIMAPITFYERLKIRYIYSIR